MPPANESNITVGGNSTRVLGDPNEDNFINFYSTVECEMTEFCLKVLFI